jgi:DNA replication and repair protein RecF
VPSALPELAAAARGRAPAIAAPVTVHRVTLRDFRSYARLELDLVAGLVLVVGLNGAGKTNLLEALHVGTQGFSPRTRADARLVRFGAQAARVSLEGESGGAAFATMVTIRPGEPKRVSLNGATLGSPDELRARLATLVFTPDRLAVVKGGPAVRRAYIDRMLGRVRPAEAELPAEYGRALAQRNAALRLVRAGRAGSDAVAPWTAAAARLGTELDRARARLVGELSPGFETFAARLGLAGASLVYEERGLAVADLEARLRDDVERGTTGVGPHLRDVRISAAGRDLRGFGSQGEQRTAVLALTLAEAAIAEDRRGEAPLLLLDDVLSELDEARRGALLDSIPAEGQTVVTATSERALPAGSAAPTLVLMVTPGEARAA